MLQKQPRSARESCKQDSFLFCLLLFLLSIRSIWMKKGCHFMGICDIVEIGIKIRKKEERCLCAELVIILFCLTITATTKIQIYSVRSISLIMKQSKNLLFDYHMKLHYSQTTHKPCGLFCGFDYHMKLHYSQTSNLKFMTAEYLVTAKTG